MILYVCMYGWMDGCMDAWMHGCMYVYSLENLLFQINIVDVFLLNAESPFPNPKLSTGLGHLQPSANLGHLWRTNPILASLKRRIRGTLHFSRMVRFCLKYERYWKLLKGPFPIAKLLKALVELEEPKPDLSSAKFPTSSSNMSSWNGNFPGRTAKEIRRHQQTTVV